MIPANTRIWIVAGLTDLRRGFVGLSAMVQTALEQNPFNGHVFVFRGKRGDLIKLLWFDGDGLCNPSAENPQNRLRVQASLLSVAPLVRSQCFDTQGWRRPRRCCVPLQTS